MTMSIAPTDPTGSDHITRTSPAQLLREVMAMRELYHYGVKGMKWGVRKSNTPVSPETKKKLLIGAAIVATTAVAGLTLNNVRLSKKILAIGESRARHAIMSENQHSVAAKWLKESLISDDMYAQIRNKTQTFPANKMAEYMNDSVMKQFWPGS